MVLCRTLKRSHSPATPKYLTFIRIRGTKIYFLTELLVWHRWWWGAPFLPPSSFTTHQECQRGKWFFFVIVGSGGRHRRCEHAHEWHPLIAPQRITNEHQFLPLHSFEEANSVKAAKQRTINHIRLTKGDRDTTTVLEKKNNTQLNEDSIKLQTDKQLTKTEKLERERVKEKTVWFFYLHLGSTEQERERKMKGPLTSGDDNRRAAICIWGTVYLASHTSGSQTPSLWTDSAMNRREGTNYREPNSL